MVVVLERRAVAELLAGGGGGGELLAVELVDEELRAVAWAVGALRAWREAPTDEAVTAIARVLGVELRGGVCEELRREGAMRRAA